MTRKDYLLIAGVLKSSLDKHPRFSDEAEAVIDVMCGMSIALASENPAFDTRKFFSACGVSPPTEQTK